MHPDIERLIQLQALDLQAADARRLQTSIPETQRALDQKMETARAAVAAAKEKLAENQTARRALDKDVSAVQTRLSRYKDQLLEVKTNREYHAMQHEIDTAQAEVKRIEDLILEQMVSGDDLAATLKDAEAGVKTAEQQISRERAELDKQLADSTGVLDSLLAQRGTLVAQLAPKVLTLYEQLARGRKGIAVAEARAERCVECQVRLRPMVYAEVRRNNTLLQCDSCQRILYYVPPAATEAAPTA